MAFTTINKSTDYFNTKLYTGNDSTQAITGVGFQPDLWWNKSRSGTHSAGVHCWFDSVRGVTKRIKSDSADAEATISGVTAFDSDGVTLGSENQSNGGSTNYAAWNWKAGGGSGGSLNQDGSIDSQVSVNSTSKFSVVTYTGAGGNVTIGHGLGVVPKIIIIKRLDSSNGWIMYNEVLGHSKYMILNTTAAEASNSTFFNATSPTSSVFSLGNDAGVNGGSATYVAYCWADVAGYQKMASYTGNGSTDGTFIYTGFKPTFTIIKRSDNSDNWFMQDGTISTFNVIDDYLLAQSTSAEAQNSAVNIDFLSNGFKIRNTDTGFNTDGGTYLYMCWGQTLVGTNDTPATAR